MLSRSPERQRLPRGVRAAGWDGRTLGPWVEELEHADAVVNLAGESIFGRWTAAKKQRIRASRVETSRLVAEAFAAVRRRPLVLVQGSAVGYYGDSGDAVVDESVPAGGRLPFPPGGGVGGGERVGGSARRAAPDRAHQRRAVATRRRAEAAACWRSAPSLGGPLGDGRQWMPWIHEADEVGAIRFLLESPAATGPFNLAAPEAVRNDDFSRALAKALHRPSWLPAPTFAVRLALGELGETMLSGQRAVPARLLALGFRFRFPTLEAAFAELLA